MCTSLKRTTVYLDADDLAVIKEAAAREEVPKAEIIREAVHRAAPARQQWDEPFFSRTCPTVSGDVSDPRRARDFRAITPLSAHQCFRLLPDAP